MKASKNYIILLLPIFLFSISFGTIQAETMLEHVESQISQATSGHAGPASMSMFNDIHNPTNGNSGNFNRNPDFWASEFDFSGVSVWNNLGWSGKGGTARSGTLITPRHMIFADHFTVYIGQEFFFVGSDNIVYSAKLIDQKRVGATDLRIGRLDKSLPSTTKPYGVMSANDLLTRLYPGGFNFIVFNQDKKAIIKKQIYSMFLGNLGHQNSTYTSLNQSLRGGDSGSPHFLTVNGELILLGTESSAGGGPYIGWFIDDINKIISDFGDSDQLNVFKPTQFAEVNLPPQIQYQGYGSSRSEFSFDEHLPVNTLLHDFNAYDFNAGQTITYSISEDGINKGIAMDSSTGRMTVADRVKFDYVGDGKINFVVTFTDNGTPSLSSSRNVVINLNNIDESTVFSSDNRAIILNSPNSRVEWVPDNTYRINFSVRNWQPGQKVYAYLYRYDENGKYLRRSAISIKVVDSTDGDFYMDFIMSNAFVTQVGEHNYNRIHLCDLYCATAGGKFGGIFDESDDYIQLHKSVRGLDNIEDNSSSGGDGSESKKPSDDLLDSGSPKIDLDKINKPDNNPSPDSNSNNSSNNSNSGGGRQSPNQDNNGTKPSVQTTSDSSKQSPNQDNNRAKPFVQTTSTNTKTTYEDIILLLTILEIKLDQTKLDLLSTMFQKKSTVQTTTPNTGLSCVRLTKEMWLGRTDSDTNGEVSLLQRFLISKGLLSSTSPLGYYGPLTTKAVETFQLQNGIVKGGTLQTTGLGGVGPLTRSVLGTGC